MMNEVRFPVEMVRGIPVVVAPEEIDITNAPRLRAALLDAASRRRAAVVVDMSGTHFCDTAGLHALVGAHRRAQAEGRRVLLVVAADAVLRILAITGLDQVLAQFSSLDDALAAAPATRPDDQISPEGTIEVGLSRKRHRSAPPRSAGPRLRLARL
jgi:anti-sigma B factor antagonist